MSESKKFNRSLLGKYGGNLAAISIFINFAGVGILAWAMFTVVPGMGFNLIFGLSYVLTPMIKALIGFMGPAFGLNILRRYRKNLAAFYFLVIGVLTMIPLVVGGFVVLNAILLVWGILPFIPHFIGGTLLIIAAILIALWNPVPESLGQVGRFSETKDKFSLPEGSSSLCPKCGHGLFGDERYCPGCAYDLNTIKD